MTENMHNTSFDSKLSQIKDLKWMPWIGANFEKSNVLIIGESFYDDGDGWPEYDPIAPRSLVLNQGLQSFKPEFANRKLFTIVEKTILNQEYTSFDEREKFWTSTAYLNLVQRTLPSRDEMPNNDDFDFGWLTTIEVIKLLKPQICIVLGYASIGRLGFILANNLLEVSYSPKEFHRKPYILNLDFEVFQTKMIPIYHPTGSRGYNYEKWAEIIYNEESSIKIRIMNN